jgi:GrpB-like predicted nucleotidyltransferase (UPF0157 family)/RimJ/RimL family protein N-acetyltransferase
MQIKVNEEIILKQISREHAVELQTLVQNNFEMDLCYFCPDLKKTYKTLESTNFHIDDAHSKFIEDGTPDLLIFYQGKLAGLISLSPLDKNQTKSEIGYWLGKEFEGKGLVSMSFPFILDYAKEKLKLSMVELSTSLSNIRSQNLPKKFGFSQVKIIPNAEELSDGFVDHILWSYQFVEKTEKSKMNKPIVVQPYNPEWSNYFLELKNFIWPEIMDFATSIEHVGSTSVVGLAAKPVIDIDIIIPDTSFLDKAIERLGRIGYEYRGNLGIVERESFKSNNHLIKHNLYVCPQSSIALKNHICLRDTLRSHPDLRDEYSRLKQELVLKFQDSIDDYVEGKTDFILKVLEMNGLSSDRLEDIRKANLAPKKL